MIRNMKAVSTKPTGSTVVEEVYIDGLGGGGGGTATTPTITATATAADVNEYLC